MFAKPCAEHVLHAPKNLVPISLSQSKKIVKKTKQPVRLYAKGVILGGSAENAKYSAVIAGVAKATSAASPTATPTAPS